MAEQYRKKPVVIEAMLHDGKDTYGIIDWIDQTGADAVFDPEDGAICIKTLEGIMAASPGDFIIRGVNGEFYPCKPDIFAKTYEPA